MSPQGCPLRLVPSGMSPQACPLRPVPSGMSPQACPLRHVPSGLSPQVCPLRLVPSGQSPQACPSGMSLRHVPSNLLPQACPLRHVPSGLSPQACPLRPVPSDQPPCDNCHTQLVKVLLFSFKPIQHPLTLKFSFSPSVTPLINSILTTITPCTSCELLANAPPLPLKISFHSCHPLTTCNPLPLMTTITPHFSQHLLPAFNQCTAAPPEDHFPLLSPPQPSTITCKPPFPYNHHHPQLFTVPHLSFKSVHSLPQPVHQ